ncbi:MAG: DNA mismatch repair endonuclease MutL [Bacteroidales bacterium]|nr:DNA mismatch repair endonuclease MutL [Bacteroidales bacterium]
MAEVIKLMSEALANQIAAGEVIQRPASVVKELVENSVDAGADKITVNIKDAGRTLIQVIDNGCGMSEKDALKSFERHATSKIYKTDDLFCIYTKGFRGEALASISSVAEVELKTAQEGDQTGTQVIFSGGEFVSQSPVSTPKGTNFAVKSLFFNVPARRKFLKADSTEFQHIITEFQRVALTHPMIEFYLYHNSQIVYSLPKAALKQRIIAICGKNLNQDLIPVEIDTSIVKITGFTGKPQAAKKRNDKQYFFVNNRYMKNPYFNKAVLLAYDKLISPDTAPPYFLYFEVDPRTIDVNVHPTKTEINFENAADIFKLVQAGIRETLNKNDVAPAIDFDNAEAASLPYFSKDMEIPEMPRETFNPYYNPFESTRSSYTPGSYNTTPQEKHNLENWQKLYSNVNENENIPFFDGGKTVSEDEKKIIQVREKYIVSPIKSGLMIIDQYRAHYRVLYNKYLLQIDNNADSIQKLLYPEKLSLDTLSASMLYDLRDEVLSIGFDLDFTDITLPVLKGIPPYIDKNQAVEILTDIIDNYKEEHGNIQTSIKDILAKSLARRQAVKAGRPLNAQEMNSLIDDLFATGEPNYSPDGKTAVVILPVEELEKKFL